MLRVVKDGEKVKKKQFERVYPLYHADVCPMCGMVKKSSYTGKNVTNIVKYCKGNKKWPWSFCHGVEREHLHCRCRLCGAQYITETAINDFYKREGETKKKSP